MGGGIITHTSGSERFLAALRSSVQQRRTMSLGVTFEDCGLMHVLLLLTDATINSLTSSIIPSLPTNTSNCMS